ncbi:MAG: 2-oxoglutarate dehydrogenase, E2 component, dihydrolipoamide succinyltransferase [Nocardioidaceae bacterium]|nr:2-oxoglutarate dehydrogenase, E2 component, dihydrolipoamide succinyltransferase [Nocardioidaceae bacterium]
MATEVTLPALGESVTEGTVTQWLKSVGDDVAVDEALLEVSTDKVDTEIPSPVAGTLLEIRADQDETVEVGAVLAVIGEKDEAGGSAGGDSGGSADSEADEHQSSDASAEQDGGSGSEESGSTDSDGDSGDSGAEGSDSGSDGPESGQTEQSSQPSAAEESPQTDEGADDSAPSEQQDAAQADAEPSGESSGSVGGGDSSEVTLPALGESVTEGTVTQWLKSVGDEVAVDEPLLEISTDKVDTEIPSPVAGTLLEIRAEQDETVEVGAVLAIIGSGDGGSKTSAPPAAESGSSEPSAEETSASEETKEPASSAAEETTEPDTSADEETKQPDTSGSEEQPDAEDAEQPASGPSGQESSLAPSAGSTVPSVADDAGGSSGDSASRSYVTPLVRKLAAQHDVELSTLTGTGVGGRIRKQDVLEAAEAAKQQAAQQSSPASDQAGSPAASQAEPSQAASSLRGKTEKLSRLRQVIAARMVESLHVSAQLTTVVEVDVTSISRLRDKAKAGFEQREGVKLSFLPFFAKAAIDALKTYPQVNASIDTEANTVTYHDGEHLGVAVDTDRGLLVPVISNAGDLSIAGLARKIADLAARTRDNKIKPDELSGGTFTLTNTGSRGALFDTPIINQPQVAILGTGTVVKRPVVISDPNLGETIAIRQMVYLSLTYDHRLVDGADAARFLTTIKQRLEEANFEADLGG